MVLNFSVQKDSVRLLITLQISAVSRSPASREQNTHIGAQLAQGLGFSLAALRGGLGAEAADTVVTLARVTPGSVGLEYSLSSLSCPAFSILFFLLPST